MHWRRAAGSDGLPGYGLVRSFRFAAPAGNPAEAGCWASSAPDLRASRWAPRAALAWGTRRYRRSLKQCCGVGKAQVRAARAQRNSISCVLRAFLRLETQRPRTGCNWYEAKK
ncbi:hypothetical protein [Hymenobacter sp.]|uniref:hypothetical protein n=1 Tax=Hymenobacter sp. TaxID=1898978 RepID=UPI00286D5802|nr:hypothetical protein [Hymenobacter sp.]